MKKTDKTFESWIAKELDRAYTEWEKGNYYKYDGAFYEVKTGKYVCPCE